MATTGGALDALTGSTDPDGLLRVWVTRDDLKGGSTATAEFIRRYGESVVQPTYGPDGRPSGHVRGKRGIDVLASGFGRSTVRSLVFDAEAVRSAVTTGRRTDKGEVVASAMGENVERGLDRRRRRAERFASNLASMRMGARDDRA